jgi:putative endonuclease
MRKALSLSKGIVFMAYFLYILRGPKNHLYVGTTSNIENRIKRHYKGDGAEFTFRNKTDKLVYTENFETLLEARRREAQIKKWRREKKENLIRFRKPIVEK